MASKPTSVTSRHGPIACRRRFLRQFPDGFADETYLAWERDYKWRAHQRWREEIGGRDEFAAKLAAGRQQDVARAAVRIEAGQPLLFSYEKMALKDAVIRSSAGARRFADGCHDWLWGDGSERQRFERWIETIAALPRRQTRVLTWPVLTVFGFIARPRVHAFLKPVAMQRAARAYGFDLAYSSTPNWDTYASFLELCRTVKRDLADLGPRDQIDVQSFLWVQGSDEY
jgi:hypothetical protein